VVFRGRTCQFTPARSNTDGASGRHSAIREKRCLPKSSNESNADIGTLVLDHLPNGG
jgi:hypothetical protein